MDPLAIDLLIILMLVLVNAAFAGTELAVVSLRRSQLVRLAQEHERRGRVLLELSEDPTRFLSTIQVGITLAGFLASATAAVSLAEPLAPALTVFGSAADIVAVVLVTIVLTFLTLVFGELVPKRVAMRHPERWALRAAVPVAFVARVARPVIWMLSRTTDMLARRMGGADVGAGDLMDDQEVLDVIATESALAPERRALVAGVIELARRTVRELLVPRRDVFVLDAELTVDEAARALATAGHSRAPVGAGGTLDDVVGIAVLGALVAGAAPQAPVTRACIEPTIVPEGAVVHDVLQLLQRERRQLALVADEHGTIVGIVTVEDLLEEIVGELYDELDRDLAPDDPRGYRRSADGWFELPGTYPVHDLADLGLAVAPDVTAATVGGMLIDAVGSVPATGEQIRVGDIELVATSVDGTIVSRVRARRA